MLTDPSSKGRVFKALANERPIRLGVQNEYPIAIKAALQTAEKRAYDLRQQTPGTKTRVIVKDGIPLVQLKAPNDRDFSWDHTV